jgi:hypothetical protein
VFFTILEILIDTSPMCVVSTSIISLISVSFTAMQMALMIGMLHGGSGV